MKYQHSQAAALIRQDLKAHGIPATVMSESYSKGSSINIQLLDNPLPLTVTIVKESVAKYQSGSEHSRDDIPQAKDVFVRADYSDEFKQLAWDHIRNILQDGEKAPESYRDADSVQLRGEWGGTWVHRVLTGSQFQKFWSNHKQRISQ